MKIGLIGFPLSGKTTVFNTLTGLHARVDSFHASGKEANVGLIKVPDRRVDALSAIYEPKKTTYAEISFVDLAGISGASGSGFEANALNLMRQVDAFTFVIRAFPGEEVLHPLGGVDPLRDIRALEEELQLADLIVIEKRQARIEKEGKRGSAEHALLERLTGILESGTPLRETEFSAEELKSLAGFGFLSLKPCLLLLNTGEDNVRGDPAVMVKYTRAIAFCAELERQVAELPAEEQGEFLQALGIAEPAREKFIRAAYDLLKLISFFTVGKDEVKAWTIDRGTEAVKAAGKIHSDIERGFIRAEVVSYEDFIQEPNMTRMKELGQLRLEGKTYPVADGDIINFRFNV